MSKPKVYVSYKVIGDGMEKIRANFDVDFRDATMAQPRHELLEKARNAEALVTNYVDKIDADFIKSCPQLKVIANVAVGFDNIDIAAANQRGIVVLHTPGVLTNATADLTFALLLSVSRRLVEAHAFIKDGNWTGWRADLMLGTELCGKTLGIVGMGRIGEAVAKRAAAFGMSTVYTRKGNEEKDFRLRRELQVTRVSLGELLSKSDFISIHCPLSPETRHLIGKTELARMKDSCILINTARGAVIDQAALIAALRARQIAGVGLDVFENEPEVPSELLEMSNVVVAPHIGSATTETRAAMGRIIADGLIAAFAGRMPDNIVNQAAWNKTLLAAR